MTLTTQGKGNPMWGMLESMPLRLLSVNQGRVEYNDEVARWWGLTP
jgi:hypothetical protein